jgi:secreted trypsin-like serine protease
MYDNINPPTSIFDGERCEKCSEMHYETELYVVYTSIEDYEEWCDKCIDNHSKHHPIMKDELWAIGSTDTENNLTIK